MATKSVIAIDINDESFKDFISLWSKYQDELKGQGTLWGQTGEAISDNVSRIDDMAKALAKQAQVEKQARDAEKKRQREQEQYDQRRLRVIRQTATAAKETAEKVTAITTGLLKWTAIGGIFAGVLGGIGSFFGMADLARSVGDQRKQATGLGISVSQLQAAKVGFSTELDSPQAALQALAQARTDPSKGWMFAGMGVNPNQDPAKMLEQARENMRKLARATDIRLLDSVMHARGFDEFFSKADIMRARGESDQEARDQRAYRAKLAREPGFDDATAKKYQDVSQSLDAAKMSIERTLVVGLEPLAEVMPDIVSTFAALVHELGPDIKELAKDLSTWLADLTHHMHQGEFKEKVEQFVTEVAAMTHAIFVVTDYLMKFADFIHMLTNPSEWLADKFKNKLGAAYRPDQTPAEQADSRQKAIDVLKADPVIGTVMKGAEAAGKAIGGAAQQIAPGLDALLSGVEWQESRNNPNAIGPMTRYGRAKGAFQFTDATAKQWGVQNVFDEKQAREGAGRYLTHLLQEFGGDVRKALAAYNWGPGHIRKYGDDWEAHAPHETRDYVAKILGHIGQRVANAAPQSKVRVDDRTGGSVNISAVGLGYNYGVS